MNVVTLQKMDRWLGVPLCFGLTLVRKLTPKPGAPSPVRSILLVKLAEQGSTVLAHAALCRAVEMTGRQNVYCLVFEENRFILDVLGVVPEENVVTISFKNFFALITSAWRALRRLRKLKLDAAVDMEFFTRASAAVTYMTGAKLRVGFHSFFGAGPCRGDLMTHRLFYNPYLHTADTFQVMVEAVQADPALLPTFGFRFSPTARALPRFSARPDEVAEVKNIFRQETGDCPPLILLNPNASDLLPLRRWPNDRYVDVARRLLDRYPEVCVVFTGAPAEAVAIGELVRAVGSKRCVSLAGRTTLRQLLILYTLAEVLVTNDSGPAHFATLTPIRVVTLFGPETPVLYAARSPRNTPLWAGIVCSPCVNAFNNRQSPCRNNLCMQQITVDQVFAETCRAYEERKGVQRT
jgi:ADP-heptose:LPS heptosyltransferase